MVALLTSSSTAVSSYCCGSSSSSSKSVKRNYSVLPSPSQNPSFDEHPPHKFVALVATTAFLLFSSFPNSFPQLLSQDPLIPVADARGLFQMPPYRLVNRYFLVRAGESETESQGLIRTNPVEKTSVDSGLSEGKRQSVASAIELKRMGACDGNCWIWPSITQRSYQAAEIIAAVNGISRRIYTDLFSKPNDVPRSARGESEHEGDELRGSGLSMLNPKDVYICDGMLNRKTTMLEECLQVCIRYCSSYSDVVAKVRI